MTNLKEESFLNDLNLSLEEAWKLLEQGKKDRHSPLHTLVVASNDEHGIPSQRIMVLRSVDFEKRMIQFNSDRRAAKIDQIKKNKFISVLGYHPEAKIQLRVFGTGEIKTDGAHFEKAWNDASPYGKRCYLANPGPGQTAAIPSSGLAPELEGVKPSEEQLVPAKNNFAILQIEIDRLEWLYLAHTGHRRAKFSWNEEQQEWDSQWLVP
ncbi:MAG: pyridoxamine 5'-phosphate oxidase family protein [Parasphingorhabdus sp.]